MPCWSAVLLVTWMQRMSGGECTAGGLCREIKRAGVRRALCCWWGRSAWLACRCRRRCHVQADQATRLHPPPAPPPLAGRSETALLLAARRGHTAAVEALLQAGARADKAARSGVTPLIAATLFGHLRTVEALLARCGPCCCLARAANGSCFLAWVPAAATDAHARSCQLLTRSCQLQLRLLTLA